MLTTQRTTAGHKEPHSPPQRWALDLLRGPRPCTWSAASAPWAPARGPIMESSLAPGPAPTAHGASRAAGPSCRTSVLEPATTADPPLGTPAPHVFKGDHAWTPSSASGRKSVLLCQQRGVGVRVFGPYLVSQGEQRPVSGAASCQGPEQVHLPLGGAGQGEGVGLYRGSGCSGGTPEVRGRTPPLWGGIHLLQGGTGDAATGPELVTQFTTLPRSLFL